RTSATAEPDERAFGRATFPRRAGLDVVEADAAHETRDPATQDGRRLLSGRLIDDAAIAGRKRGVGRRLFSSAARAFELADALPGPELRLLKKIGDALVRAIGIGEAARHVPHGGLEQIEKARHRVVITGLRAAQKLADVVAFHRSTLRGPPETRLATGGEFYPVGAEPGRPGRRERRGRAWGRRRFSAA